MIRNRGSLSKRAVNEPQRNNDPQRDANENSKVQVENHVEIPVLRAAIPVREALELVHRLGQDVDESAVELERRNENFERCAIRLAFPEGPIQPHAGRHVERQLDDGDDVKSLSERTVVVVSLVENRILRRESLVDLVRADQTVQVEVDDDSVQEIPAGAPRVEGRESGGGSAGDVVGEDADEKREGDGADHEGIREVFDGLLRVMSHPERRDGKCEGAKPEEGIDDEEHFVYFIFLDFRRKKRKSTVLDLIERKVFKKIKIKK